MDKMDKKALLSVKEMCKYLVSVRPRQESSSLSRKTILPTDYMHTKAGWIHG